MLYAISSVTCQSKKEDSDLYFCYFFLKCNIRYENCHVYILISYTKEPDSRLSGWIRIFYMIETNFSLFHQQTGRWLGKSGSNLSTSVHSLWRRLYMCPSQNVKAGSSFLTSKTHDRLYYELSRVIQTVGRMVRLTPLVDIKDLGWYLGLYEIK